MNKLILLVSVGSLGACTQQDPSTPLHQLGETHLELVANGQINIEMKVLGGSCVQLGDDVHATFDGQPMHVARGGSDQTADGCYPIAFWINPTEMDGIKTFEAGAASSDMIIEDASARWTISSTRLFANQFSIDTANSQIVWQDVTAITSALLRPTVPVTIAGNVIHYPAGTNILSVSAYAHPTPMRCEGPSLCQVDLNGAHDFQSNPL